MAFLGKLKDNFNTSFSFFGDSWAELKKVKWPNRKELTSYTIVVVSVVVFVTIYFSIIDTIISNIVRLVTK